MLLLLVGPENLCVFLLVAVACTHSYVSAFGVIPPTISWTRQATLFAQAETETTASSTAREFYQTLNHLVEKRCQAVSNNERKAMNVYIVDYDDLLQMKNASPSGAAQRQNFADILQKSGGYCVVRLTDSCHISTMDGLWETLKFLYHNKPTSPMVRRQILSWNETTADGESGYDYIHFPPVDKESANQLRNMIGTKANENISDAFELLCLMGEAFSIVACDLFCDPHASGDDRWSTTLIENLVVDNESKASLYSGSFMRLSQYIKSKSSSMMNHQDHQSLRPHSDWSFVTIVPVSNVPGLELYTPADKRWTCPEEVLLHNNEQDGNSNANWNSKYAVVFSGKWLEILTNGRIESTIHRVVSHPNHGESRLSVPLFLRPRPEMSNRIDELFQLSTEVSFETARSQLGAFIQRFA